MIPNFHDKVLWVLNTPLAMSLKSLVSILELKAKPAESICFLNTAFLAVGSSVHYIAQTDSHG
jgi:hypothetical protein